MPDKSVLYVKTKDLANMMCLPVNRFCEHVDQILSRLNESATKGLVEHEIWTTNPTVSDRRELLMSRELVNLCCVQFSQAAPMRVQEWLNEQEANLCGQEKPTSPLYIRNTMQDNMYAVSRDDIMAAIAVQLISDKTGAPMPDFLSVPDGLAENFNYSLKHPGAFMCYESVTGRDMPKKLSMKTAEDRKEIDLFYHDFAVFFYWNIWIPNGDMTMPTLRKVNIVH